MSVSERSSRRPRRLMRPLAQSRKQKAESRNGQLNPSAFCLLLSAFQSRGEIVAFQNTVEDAVDELRRFVVAELLGDLDGLVDHDQLRRLAFVQKLVDRQTDDVAVDDGH